MGVQVVYQEDPLDGSVRVDRIMNSGGNVVVLCQPVLCWPFNVSREQLRSGHRFPRRFRRPCAGSAREDRREVRR